MASMLVEKLAAPLASVAVPSVVVPSLKLTVPVGVPLVPFTVVLNVTDVPMFADAGAERVTVAVAGLLMVSVCAVDVLTS